eukprot:TRINITY_DN8254_c0_g1_i3.p1 TRINITY_DN8254_c0_g1~~TRINITY_DN8254_c0_g1_i3.p1  ORF type:complete len:270 (-),score=50.88 TRINITY_DN8254_c0_g1_i3:267-1076(-)
MTSWLIFVDTGFYAGLLPISEFDDPSSRGSLLRSDRIRRSLFEDSEMGSLLASRNRNANDLNELCQKSDASNNVKLKTPIAEGNIAENFAIMSKFVKDKEVLRTQWEEFLAKKYHKIQDLHHNVKLRVDKLNAYLTRMNRVTSEQGRQERLQAISDKEKDIAKRIDTVNQLLMKATAVLPLSQPEEKMKAEVDKLNLRYFQYCADLEELKRRKSQDAEFLESMREAFQSDTNLVTRENVHKLMALFETLEKLWYRIHILKKGDANRGVA